MTPRRVGQVAIRPARLSHVHCFPVDVLLSDPATPTPEQLADRYGRDDGIRIIRPEVIARLRRWKIYRLTKQISACLVPSPFAKGEKSQRDHRNGYWLIHVQTGNRYLSITEAATKLKLKAIGIRRSLKGRRVPSLRGNTFRLIPGGKRTKSDLRHSAA